MAIIHPVAALYDAVVARFLLEGPLAQDGNPVPNLFGWRTPAEQLVNVDRICWVPGDPNGMVGLMLPPVTGGEPRALWTMQEIFYVDIIAADRTQPENERLQYEAVRTLYDYWVRAMHHAAYAIGVGGQIGYLQEQWLTEKLERRYGAALRAVCTVLSPIVDAAPDGSSGALAPADTQAVIDVHELDVTETIIVKPDDVP